MNIYHIYLYMVSRIPFPYPSPPYFDASLRHHIVLYVYISFNG